MMKKRQKNLKRCQLCDFTTLWSLKKHMKHVHKGINKEVVMIKCQWDGCNYESHKNFTLDKHVKSHIGLQV